MPAARGARTAGPPHIPPGRLNARGDYSLFVFYTSAAWQLVANRSNTELSTTWSVDQ
ncbi:MAG: hypothetical protein HOQ09_07010 [Gemmatimonadaceae bacterium]|nr:hypothetical protein [Gemmatimonadaceae bacterium]